MASWLSSLALVLTAFLAFRPTLPEGTGTSGACWSCMQQTHLHSLCTYVLIKKADPEGVLGAERSKEPLPYHESFRMNTYTLESDKHLPRSLWLTFPVWPLLWPLCHTKNSLVNMPAVSLLTISKAQESDMKLKIFILNWEMRFWIQIIHQSFKLKTKMCFLTLTSIIPMCLEHSINIREYGMSFALRNKGNSNTIQWPK